MATFSWNTTATFNPADTHDRTSMFRQRVGTYTGPVSYATNGETPSLSADIGFSKVNQIIFGVGFNGTDTVLFRWNPTTLKIQAFVPETGVEVANGTDLSLYTCSVLIYGQ